MCFDKYNYEKAPIVTIEYPISSESNIIVTNAVNLKSQQDFRVNIGYTNTFSKLNLHLEGEAVFPSGKYSYLNQYYNTDKISFNGNLKSVIKSVQILVYLHHSVTRDIKLAY